MMALQDATCTDEDAMALRIASISTPQEVTWNSGRGYD
jgi:hypothetical protein